MWISCFNKHSYEEFQIDDEHSTFILSNNFVECVENA